MSPIIHFVGLDVHKESVPDERDERDEAIRDLVRVDQLKARQRLKGFLLQHGLRYGGNKSWTEKHQRYLASLVMPSKANFTNCSRRATRVRTFHVPALKWPGNEVKTATHVYAHSVTHVCAPCREG